MKLNMDRLGNKKSSLFLLFSITFQSCASLMSKFAANSTATNSLYLLITNKYYFFSLVFLFLQAICWQLTLKEMDLSVAYPLTSVNNLIILVFSYYLFHEHVTLNNVIGVIIIVAGIVILNIKREPK